jgi:hypothetical protein
MAILFSDTLDHAPGSLNIGRAWTRPRWSTARTTQHSIRLPAKWRAICSDCRVVLAAGERLPKTIEFTNGFGGHFLLFDDDEIVTVDALAHSAHTLTIEVEPREPASERV